MLRRESARKALDHIARRKPFSKKEKASGGRNLLKKKAPFRIGNEIAVIAFLEGSIIWVLFLGKRKAFDL